MHVSNILATKKALALSYATEAGGVFATFTLLGKKQMYLHGWEQIRMTLRDRSVNYATDIVR